ncbi:unnamed protein product [Hydatigera taeniaeformis]|uniref:PHB domain-containing protein n=1 Tax=Hydatigena taeniaeformis TaxID=6205 RepID=A0A0R3X8W4_HYDTA|nr:unnamed protein product [Hydatigera taeniaeformis]
MWSLVTLPVIQIGIMHMPYTWPAQLEAEAQGNEPQLKAQLLEIVILLVTYFDPVELKQFIYLSSTFLFFWCFIFAKPALERIRVGEGVGRRAAEAIDVRGCRYTAEGSTQLTDTVHKIVKAMEHANLRVVLLKNLAVSGVDYTIKLLQPMPLPLDETEDDFIHRIEKRKADAAELMRLNLAMTQQVVESSVSLRQQLASFRIGRMARLFLLQLAERQTGSVSTTATAQNASNVDRDRGDDDDDDDADDSDDSDDRDSPD